MSSDTPYSRPPAVAPPPAGTPGGSLKAFLAFASFCLMIGGYALLKPVRDAYFLHRLGFMRMPEYDAKVAFGSLVVVTLYNLIAARIPRRILIGCGYLLFLAGIVSCAILLQGEAKEPAAEFYVGLNLSWLLLLAVFWSAVNDVFGVGEGRRWYALIAFGGPLGAIAGSLLAREVSKAGGIGSLSLLWIAAVVFGLAGALALAMEAAGRRYPSGEPPRVVLASAFPDLRLLFRSRYVLAIAGIMFFGVFSMKIYTLDFNRLLGAYVPGQEQKVQWVADRTLTVNVLGMLIQIAVTPFLLKRHGPGAALAVLPLFVLAGGMLLGWHEVFWVAFALTAGAEGLAYTLNQSAKELLYVPGDHSLKYQAKALVDVFCFRLGEMTASMAILVQLALFPYTDRRTLGPVVGLAVGVAALWLLCARAAGRGFDAATRARPGTPAAAPDAAPTGEAVAAAAPKPRP